MNAPEASGSDRSKLLLQHLALIVSFSLVLVATFRALVVSRLQIDVALLVLSRSDRPSLLASTLMQLLAVIGPMVLVADRRAFRWLQEGARDGATRSQRIRSAAWLAFGVILLAFVTLPVLLGSLAGLAVAPLGRMHLKRVQRRNPEKPLPSEADRRETANLIEYMYLLSIFSLAATSLSAPWVPLERLTLVDEGDPLIGYVIDDRSDGWLVLDRQRNPVWIDSVEVSDRHLCRAESFLLVRPAIDLIAREANRVGCEQSDEVAPVT